MNRIISDGITAPQSSAHELKSALRTIVSHYRDGTPLDHATKERILEIFEDVGCNDNWVIYVP